MQPEGLAGCYRSRNGQRSLMSALLREAPYPLFHRRRSVLERMSERPNFAPFLCLASGARTTSPLRGPLPQPLASLKPYMAC